MPCTRILDATIDGVHLHRQSEASAPGFYFARIGDRCYVIQRVKGGNRFDWRVRCRGRVVAYCQSVADAAKRVAIDHELTVSR